MEQPGNIKMSNARCRAIMEHNYSRSWEQERFQPKYYLRQLQEMESNKRRADLAKKQQAYREKMSNKCRDDLAKKQRAYREKIKKQETEEEAKKRRASEAERIRAYIRKRRQQETDEEAERRREKQAQRQFAYRQRQKLRMTAEQVQLNREKKKQWKRAYRQKMRQQETREEAIIRRAKHAEKNRSLRKRKRDGINEEERELIDSFKVIKKTFLLRPNSRINMNEIGYKTAPVVGSSSTNKQQIDVANNTMFGEAFSYSENEESNFEVMQLKEESQASSDDNAYSDVTSFQATRSQKPLLTKFSGEMYKIKLPTRQSHDNTTPTTSNYLQDNVKPTTIEIKSEPGSAPPSPTPYTFEGKPISTSKMLRIATSVFKQALNDNNTPSTSSNNFHDQKIKEEPSYEIKSEPASPAGSSPSPFTTNVPASNLTQEDNYVEHPITKSEAHTRMIALKDEIDALNESLNKQNGIYKNYDKLKSERFFAYHIKSNLENIIYEKEQEYEDLANIYHHYN